MLVYPFNLSYEQAERHFLSGYISKRDWSRYCKAWDWSEVRYSSTPAWKQEHFVRRRGMEALRQRFERVNRALQAISLNRRGVA